jgi:hypothetical protein
MSPGWRILRGSPPFSSACCGDCRGNRKEGLEVKNLKKAVAVTMVAGGLLAAGAGMASATDGAHADGKAVGSPGVASGNLVQAPIHIPANVSGNTVNVVGVLNPAFDNLAVNR